MEHTISEEIFTKLLHSKERESVYTAHAIEQARKRSIISDQEKVIPVFERDIKSKPYLVVEQDSEEDGERKFKVYYESPAGGFMAYILVLNKWIRVITIYKTSKELQRKVYRYERRSNLKKEGI